jgi:hypothetical protein
MRNKNTKERYFVTWQDTLHPENALLVPNDLPPTAGQVDRWGTVWAEARIVSDDEATSSTQSSPLGVDEKVISSDEASIVVAPMPVAEVTLGNIEDDYETVTTDDAANSLPNRHAAAAAAAEPLNHSLSRSPCSQGRFLDVTIGSSLTIAAVAAVFAIEISAIVVYGLAVGFFHTYRQLAKISSRLPFLWLFVFVFALVTQVLKVVDSLLLAISVFLSEVLAGVTCLLCSLFGGCHAGSDWHQFIRRVCHLTRWSVRDLHHKWTPERRIFSFNLDLDDAANSGEDALPRFHGHKNETGAKIAARRNAEGASRDGASAPAQVVTMT